MHEYVSLSLKFIFSLHFLTCLESEEYGLWSMEVESLIYFYCHHSTRVTVLHFATYTLTNAGCGGKSSVPMNYKLQIERLTKTQLR